MFLPQKSAEAVPKQAAAKPRPKAAPTSMHSPAWAKQPLQRSLKVNQPGDRYEQEADQVAEQVMRMPEPRVQRRCACGGAAGPDGECAACRAQRLMLQRQEMLEEEELPVQTLQRRSTQSSEAARDAPASVHQTLRRGGQPLEISTRAYMEPRFGQDFSDVRVHTDAQAAQSAADVNAKAYTVGQDIVFGLGEYTPSTNAGRKLIVHELIHTLQQSDKIDENLLGFLPISHLPSSSTQVQQADGSTKKGSVKLCDRDFAGMAGYVVPARHCFVWLLRKLETPIQINPQDTLTYDNKTNATPDEEPNRSGRICRASYNIDPDCVKKEYEQYCHPSAYHLSSFNCCSCAYHALKSCGADLQPSDFPPQNQGTGLPDSFGTGWKKKALERVTRLKNQWQGAKRQFLYFASGKAFRDWARSQMRIPPYQ
jgi:hypothetical protein